MTDYDKHRMDKIRDAKIRICRTLNGFQEITTRFDADAISDEELKIMSDGFRELHLCCEEALKSVRLRECTDELMKAIGLRGTPKRNPDSPVQ